MRKIFILLLLIFLDIFLYMYLQNIYVSKKAYVLNIDKKPVLVRTKDIEFYDTKDFKFDDFFYFINKPTKYNYNFLDNEIIVNYLFDGKEYINNYEYHILQKEVIEKVIIKKEYIKENYSTPIIENKPKNEISYITNNMNFSIGTDIMQINNALYSNITYSSVDIRIDISNINPNVEGIYVAHYIYEGKKIDIIINII